MTTPTSPGSRASLIAALALFFSILVMRVVFAASGFQFGNFAPMIAMVMCGAYFLTRPGQWLIPAIAYMLSDIWITTQIYHSEFSLMYPVTIAGFYAVLALTSRSMGSRMTRIMPALLATAGGAIAFYLITNSAAWLTNPVYSKSLGGWIQAQTTGDPAYSMTPTWTFLRNSLVGNLVFTTLFVSLVHRNQSAKPAESVDLELSQDPR